MHHVGPIQLAGLMFYRLSWSGTLSLRELKEWTDNFSAVIDQCGKLCDGNELNLQRAVGASCRYFTLGCLFLGRS